MSQGVTAAVVGASGYAGAELIRLLAGHPEFSVGGLAGSQSRVGSVVTSYLPNLVEFGDQTFVASTAPEIGAADVVFVALPHGESAALVSQLASGQRVVDLGADFRLTDADQWQKYYGGAHAGKWTYGLPELAHARPVIASSDRVANPGCYATAIQLALAPVLAVGLVEPEDIVVVAASGTSGAGRKASDVLLASNVMGSMSAYKVGGMHQHTPEIEQQLELVAGAPVRLSFTPLLAPMSRGILATVTATLTPGASAESVAAAFTDAYADEPFVYVLPSGSWPQTSSVYGTNACHVQYAIDEHSGRVIIITAIDNLGKGAAGQALQNANLMFGFDETAGLTSLGVAP